MQTTNGIPHIRKCLEKTPCYTTAKRMSTRKVVIAFDPPTLLASNENPWGPSPKAMEAVRRALQEPNLHRYPDPQGDRLLKKLADHHGVLETSILLGNGSSELLQMAARTFGEPGDDALISEHVYAQIPIFCETAGLNVVKIPAHNFGHDLEAIYSAIGDRTRIIYLVNPNNPTGTSFSFQELESFLAKVPREVAVVLDEAYHEFNPHSDSTMTSALPERFHNLIVTRTFSKVYGLAGFRVGYAIGSSPIIDALKKVKIPFSINQLALVAAEAALEDLDHLRLTVQQNAEQKKTLISELDHHDLKSIPSAGNFICVDVGARAGALVNWLFDRTIGVRPLDSLGMPGFIRITIGTPKDVHALCREIRNFFAHHPDH